MSYAGIDDYGMGRTNVDHEAGTHFGVISQRAIAQAWSDSAEPDYGKPACPKCGSEVFGDGPSEGFEQYEDSGCAEFICADCEITIDGSDCYGDETIGWNYDGDGYQMTDCLDSDVMILASPYFTFAPYCSPCVPGAGDLDSASEGEFDESNGVKTYCVGHDWFPDGFAPYDVYSVQSGAIVPRPPTAVCYFLHRENAYGLYVSTGEHVADQPYYRSFWIVPGTLSSD